MMTFEERLNRLERQNRMLWMAAVAFAAVACTGFAAATSGSQNVPDVIKARAFHVVSKDGTPIVKLEDSDGSGKGFGGVVTALDHNGQALVRRGAGEYGAGELVTLDSKGHLLVRLLYEGGYGMIGIVNRKGIDLVQLGVKHDGSSGSFTIRNDKRSTIVQIGSIDTGGMVVGLAASNREGMVAVYDPTGGKKRGVLLPRR